jgi:hypothetical protein
MVLAKKQTFLLVKRIRTYNFTVVWQALVLRTGPMGWYGSITSLQQCARHDSRNFQATAQGASSGILQLVCGNSLALYNGQQPSADRWSEPGEVRNILVVWVHNLNNDYSYDSSDNEKKQCHDAAVSCNLLTNFFHQF